MSFIDNIEIDSKPIIGPYLGVIYGPPGVGKSFLGTYSEEPFYISLEEGTNALSVPRFKLKSGKLFIPALSSHFFELLDHVMNNVDCKTIVIDSLRFAEHLFYAEIIENNPVTGGKEKKPVKSIEDLGFDGMGYAMDYWKRLIAFTKAARKRGKNVILISHSHLVNFTSREGKTHKEITLALQAYGAHNVPELIASSADWCYHLDAECDTIQIGSGKWAKNVAMNTSPSNIVVTTRRTGLIRNAKTRAVNEENIPDIYVFDRMSRDEVSKQIFNDLTK